MTGVSRARVRVVLVDAAVIFAIIAVVLLGGLYWGRALSAGRAEVADWLSALGLITLVGLTAGIGRLWPRWRSMLPWALVGAVGCVLLLCTIATASQFRHPREVETSHAPRFEDPSRHSPPWGDMGPRLRGDDEKGSVGNKGGSRRSLSVGVITSLDIVWSPDGRRPPLVEALGPAFRFTPVAQIDPASLSRFDRLLIAQPRLLQPEELVAIDDWVRDGGRALILADPWLHWPSDFPPGDRRRPPLTSLLDPLLKHWGLVLEPADPKADVDRRFLEDGMLMPVSGASAFIVSGTACKAQEGGLMAACRIGRGMVRLIADADLIDDRLWLSDPNQAANRGYWSGDTPELIGDWLRDPLKNPGKARISWIRSGPDLIAGVRWSLIAGLVWAMLGAALFRRWSGPGRTGNDPAAPGKHMLNAERR